MLTRLTANDAALHDCYPTSSSTLSAMDVLRVIQTSLDELALPCDPELVELKRKVLEEVSAGRLTNALNLAMLHIALAAAEAALAADSDVN
jgi:hypothetical protein